MSLPIRQSITASQRVFDLLTRLHKLSLAQEEALRKPDGEYMTIQATPSDERDRIHAQAMRDKFIALDADKAAFMYNLVRATGALSVVEAGTSYGVSTIYLALAVGQNARAMGKTKGEAKVIGTEHESRKAEQARAYWSEAGSEVEDWVELRDGDLRQTLASNLDGLVDFVLLDIWTPMVMPTIEILEPKLKVGAIILADNTVSSADGYSDFLNKIRAPGSGYKSLTLPFGGGLEMITYYPQTQT